MYQLRRRGSDTGAAMGLRAGVRGRKGQARDTAPTLHQCRISAFGSISSKRLVTLNSGAPSHQLSLPCTLCHAGKKGSRFEDRLFTGQKSAAPPPYKLPVLQRRCGLGVDHIRHELDAQRLKMLRAERA